MVWRGGEEGARRGEGPRAIGRRGWMRVLQVTGSNVDGSTTSSSEPSRRDGDDQVGELQSPGRLGKVGVLMRDVSSFGYHCVSTSYIYFPKH